LGGILLELGEGTITMAATDSRRLAVVNAACRSEGDGKLENEAPVIPSKAMLLAERSITDEEQDVLIAVHANDVLMKCGQFTIYSRLVEGRFPKYENVVPKECNVAIELVVGPFHSVIRQAQIVTSEESRGVDFAFSDGLLTLHSKAADVGQSKVELPISYDYEDLTITFDPRFIAEFLRGFEPEKQVKLQLIDAESAAVFRSDDSYSYVIMPLSRDR
jgi:DNA polymerase-3 subunit beta